MRRSFFFLYFLSVLFGMLAGCRPDECFHFDGTRISEDRILEPFSKIRVRSVFTIELSHSPDSLSHIRLTGSRGSLSHVEASVSDSTLVLTDQNKCAFLRSYEPVRLLIQSPHFSELILDQGARIFSSDTIHFQSLIIQINGGIGETDLCLKGGEVRLSLNGATGTYLLKGACDACYLYMDGYGSVDARALNCQYGEVISKTTADSYIRVASSLFAQVLSKGNVHYFGNPGQVNAQFGPYGGELIQEAK